MNWLDELRYTLKVLGKNFRFTLLCASVIFVGIMIVLPTYGLLDNLALKTPRLGAGDEYVVLKKELVRSSFLSSYDTFHAQTFKDKAASFDALYAWRSMTATISDGEYAEGFTAAAIEPALVQRVQAQPLLGRLLLPEDATGAPPVALIGYAVWQTYYAGREDIVGHQSRINGEMRTIVGVMPEDFGFPLDQRVWLPLALAAGANPGEGAEDLSLVGILADGVSMAEASTEVGLLQAGILADWPEPYAHIRTSSAQPYVYFNVAGGGTSPLAFAIILGSIVLLVACNIGNLFVARGEERIQELAVRSALGATPARVARSLLLESFVVCLAGLLVGWLWTWFGLAWIEATLVKIGAGAMTEYFWWDLSLNARMLSASALTVMLVWLGSGGLPAWRISRTNLNELLNSNSKGLTEGGANRVSKILVNVQLALGCVLLTLGISVLGLAATEEMTTQANADSLYVARFTLSADMQAEAPAWQGYIDRLEQGLLNQPGVDGVAFTNAPPAGGSGVTQAPYNIEDRDLQVNGTWPLAHRVFITERYFDLIEAALQQGRNFGAEDTGGSLPVAIVDQRLAEDLWPGEAAVGKRIQINPDDNAPWLTVVGVVEPIVMEASLVAGETGMPGIYRPLQQATSVRQWRVLVSAADPAFDYLDTLRRAAATADRDVPLTGIQSFKAIEETRASDLEFTGSAFTMVMLVAIYLTAAATYGLAARAAGRRRMEAGIRMALGASPAACIRVFLKDGCKMVAYGLGTGGILAVIVSYMTLTSLGDTTFAMRAIMPTTLSLALVMGGLVMLANYFPARKIVAMEPADALRYE